jgi:hypothetical protein
MLPRVWSSLGSSTGPIIKQCVAQGAHQQQQSYQQAHQWLHLSKQCCIHSSAASCGKYDRRTPKGKVSRSTWCSMHTTGTASMLSAAWGMMQCLQCLSKYQVDSCGCAGHCRDSEQHMARTGSGTKTGCTAGCGGSHHWTFQLVWSHS